jgi:hypothetical protein
VETGGKCHLKGQSGEGGCLQFLPATWQHYSNEVLGYVAPMTEINEIYVTAKYYEKLLASGRSETEIALFHNQGSFKPCSSGVNKHGVKYDSCHYKKIVLAQIQKTSN